MSRSGDARDSFTHAHMHAYLHTYTNKRRSGDGEVTLSYIHTYTHSYTYTNTRTHRSGDGKETLSRIGSVSLPYTHTHIHTNTHKTNAHTEAVTAKRLFHEKAACPYQKECKHSVTSQACSMHADLAQQKWHRRCLQHCRNCKKECVWKCVCEAFS
jgi:hypothetical protein